MGESWFTTLATTPLIQWGEAYPSDPTKETAMALWIKLETVHLLVNQFRFSSCTTPCLNMVSFRAGYERQIIYDAMAIKYFKTRSVHLISADVWSMIGSFGCIIGGIPLIIRVIIQSCSKRRIWGSESPAFVNDLMTEMHNYIYNNSIVEWLTLSTCIGVIYYLTVRKVWLIEKKWHWFLGAKTRPVIPQRGLGKNRLSACPTDGREQLTLCPIKHKRYTRRRE
jgi:hypothetical protein